MASFNPLSDLFLGREGPFANILTKSPARWTRALGLAISLASLATASPNDELPDPTATADLLLAPLDDIWYRKPTRAPAPIVADELLMDTRIPFYEGSVWTMLHPHDHDLRKRATEKSTTSSDDSVTTTFEITISTAPSTTLTSSTTSKKTTTTTDKSSKMTTSSTATSTSSTATTTASSLPTFFDGGLSNNFSSQSCPTFIDNMIAAEEFNACYPISLLIQSSNSFFNAEKSLVSMSTVLDHSCAANVTTCASYLSNVAENMTKTDNCGDDYNLGNPTVTQAYIGLIAYQVVYSATCLKDDTTAVYCFADAVTNTTNNSETYFYFLPLDSSLPGGTNPICAGCLKDTMNIYHIATANREQPIANTYTAAAQQVNTMCGPSFSNASLADAITTKSASSTVGRGPPTWLMVTTLLIVLSNYII